MVGRLLLLDFVVLRPSQGLLSFKVVIILHTTQVVESMPLVAECGFKRRWFGEGVLSLHLHAWWRTYLHHCIGSTM